MIVSTLAGLGHPLRCLLKIAGLARSTYYYLLSHPEPVTRPDIEPMVAEVFHRTPNGLRPPAGAHVPRIRVRRACES